MSCRHYSNYTGSMKELILEHHNNFFDLKFCHGKSQSQHTFRRYDEDVFKAKWININSKKEYTSHIIERMKLANPNRSRIIPSQGG